MTPSDAVPLTGAEWQHLVHLRAHPPDDGDANLAAYLALLERKFAAEFPSTPVPVREPEVPKDSGPSRRVNVEKLARVNGLIDPDHVRIIEGIASSPRGSTKGFALDPLGASWELPLPLCVDHDTARGRIGWVVDAQARPTGITFTAKLAKHGFYPEVDDAWIQICSGDLPCVSVACSEAREWRERVDVDRVAHLWSWKELTVCSQGANRDAKILRALTVRYGKEIVMRDVRPQRPVVRLCAHDTF